MKIIIIRSLFFFVVALGYCSAFAQPVTQTATHDISGVLFLSPIANERVEIGTTFTPSFRIKNLGTSLETSDSIFLVIKSPKGISIYRDVVVLKNIAVGSQRDTIFRVFYTSQAGKYQLCAYSNLQNDEDRSNDTLCINITVAKPSNIVVDSILSPFSGQVFAQGTAVPLTGAYRATGGAQDFINTHTRVQIYSCDNDLLVFQSDTIIPTLKIDSPSVQCVFPTHQGIYNINSLPLGCYQITMSAFKIGDTSTYAEEGQGSFLIVASSMNNTVRPDTIIQPITSQRYLTFSDIPIKIRFHNVGLADQTNVNVSAVVINQRNGVVYRDTATISSWKSGETKEVTFKSLIYTLSDEYRVYGISLLKNDQDKADDTTSIPFFWGLDNDAEAVRIVYPLADEKIKEGTDFTIKAEFRWVGSSDSYVDIPVRFVIRRCADDFVIAQVDSTIALLNHDTNDIIFSFPSKVGEYSSKALIPGCYQLCAILRGKDYNSKNDTTCSSFTITDKARVNGNEDQSTSNFSLEQNRPNPFATKTSLRYSLPTNGRVTIRIADIAGKVIRTEMSNEEMSVGEHEVTIDLRGTPSGTYFCELTFTNSRGEILHRVKAITLSK